jgi:hypothetical protein
MRHMSTGTGTKADPWVLRTAPGTSEYMMDRDDAAYPPQLVCTVGSTKLTYDARAIDELHAMLVAHGDWMDLGGADEQKPAAAGTVEAWGRSGRAIAAGSGCTCRRCSRRSGWRSSVTTRRTTGCGRADRARSGRVDDGPVIAVWHAAPNRWRTALGG